jgi:hypothetical protein
MWLSACTTADVPTPTLMQSAEWQEGNASIVLSLPENWAWNLIDENADETPDGGICFVEMTQLKEHIVDISRLIIYHWNRHYPSDKKLDIEPHMFGFKMTAKYEFVGSSHEKITKGIYEK